MARKTHRRKQNQNRRSQIQRTFRRKTFRRSFKKSLPIAYGHIFHPQCGHCTALVPEWEKVKTMMGSRMQPVDINGEDSKKMDYEIHSFNRKYKSDLKLNGGYPTIYKLKTNGGSVEFYDGERKSNKIVAWLKDNQTNGGGFFDFFGKPKDPNSVQLSQEQPQPQEPKKSWFSGWFGSSNKPTPSAQPNAMGPSSEQNGTDPYAQQQQ